MNGEAPGRDGFREGPHLGRCIDRAAFRRLGDRQRLSLDVVETALVQVAQRARHRRRGQLAARARKIDQLGAVAEEFRRAAFVFDDVAVLMGNDGAPGLDEAGEGESVGCRAGRDEEGRDLAFEHDGKAVLDPSGPVVAAIAGGRPVIGSRQRGHDTGAGAGGVVADEVHGRRVTRPARSCQAAGAVRRSAPCACRQAAEQEAGRLSPAFMP